MVIVLNYFKILIIKGNLKDTIFKSILLLFLGTADFLGLNYYTTNVIRPAKPGETIGFWFLSGSPELKAVLERPPGSYYGSSPILPVSIF